MSATPRSFPQSPRSPDVLGELLHSLSQPLTSLLCSLELSLEQVAERQHESVAAALQQTERVVGMVRLMQEYLDAGQPGPEPCPAARARAMRCVIDDVIEELSSIAAVRRVRLLLAGTCSVKLPVAESRLRLALQYLIAPMIEAQPAEGKVMLLLGEGPAGTVLRGEGERRSRDLPGATSTVCRVKLAIARRVFESAGASLVLDDGDFEGFVLSMPRSN